MAREQTGICAEPNLHGVFLLFNGLEGREKQLKLQLGKISPLIDLLAEQFSEAMLNSVVALGSALWPKLAINVQPDFPSWSELGQTEITVPAFHYDLLIHLRADRFDVLYIALSQVMQLLAFHAELVEQWFCFRYLDGRDLTGFYDNPDNPRGRAKRTAALIEQAGNALNGGSYLLLTKQNYEMHKWLQLSQEQQQDLVGRYKVSGQLLPSAQRDADSMAERANLEPQGKRLRLLWQNMPYADAKQQGLVALGCSAEPADIVQYLSHRLGTSDGYDRMLDYCPIEQGALFFAPSLNMLEKWG
ncbi:Dyp-type peroxidase [Rheinheimera sp.]|uniref:Dyp-type peroxidase n=1 Tax=Rheinheimera sp. TaxID=1869214 RepID=UPI00307CCD42